MQAWVQKECHPHRNEWEETLWPDSILKRAGELGFLGLCFPEEYGGQGGDYFYSLVRAECMSYSGSGGLNMGFAVHTDMALPPIHLLGTEELKQRYLVPGIKGEKISCLGITEPGAGSDVAGIRTTAKRDGDEYVINGAKTFITNGAARRLHRPGHQDRPGRGPRRDHPVRRRPAGRGGQPGPGLQRLAQAGEDGHARLGHRRALLRGRPRPGREHARPGGQGLLPHLLGAPGRAAGRRGGLRRRRRADVRAHARVRQGAPGVRPPDRQVPGDPPQVRRDGDARSRPPSS